MTMQQKTVNLFKRLCKTYLQPIPKIKVSEWADTYRRLSPESSAEPGKWKTDRAPYQREIMDSFTQPGIKKVIAKLLSQGGKSDIMNNVIGRFSHVDPAPMLMIQPTIEMAQDFSKSRISPMIRDTPPLKERYRDVKTRNTNNTILSKVFPGGRLVMGGSNSPAGLASRPIRILLADEVDRFSASAGTEGDPLGIAEKRLTTFWNAVEGVFSTPTIKGESRIEDEYIIGTQEEWQHKCPNCKEYHLINHRNIITDHVETIDKNGTKHVFVKKVEWRCPDCGFGFSEAEMRRAKQKYVPQNASALSKGVRSFFVNCFASPWLGWAEVMQEWLEARGDPEKEKVVVNTRFAETYERKGNFEDEDIFLKRREKYGAELPDGVLLLTAAVDTQDNRLEYEIEGWGIGEENWGIVKGIIPGMPDVQSTWDELDKVLEHEYKFANGRGLLVARTFIDTGGHYSKEVYQYCYRTMARQRFPIKGSSVPGVPVIHKYSKAEAQIGQRKVSIPLVLLGTDSAKQYIMDRLSIEVPGPKYYHFPLDDEAKDQITESLYNRGYDQIYFKGLISEQRVPKKKNGKTIWTWENIATDKRNEPLDLRVYNLACMQSLTPKFEELKQYLDGKNQGQINTEKSKKTTKKRSFGAVRREY